MKDYPKRPDISTATIDANTSLAAIARLVGSEKSVLDVGCASGYQARLLAENGCRVVGIEINADAAAEAREICETVYVADVERTPIERVVDGRQFDVIVFGDVLEHLRDPVRVLDEARHALSPGGFVVISIPNVAHGAVRLGLLRGSFDYKDLGILDDTHLRFFTLKTVDELCAQAGYDIGEMVRTTLEIFADSNLVPRVDRTAFLPAIVSEVEADSESRTLQFVFRAHPQSGNDRVREIAKRYVAANSALAEANATIERLRQSIPSNRTSSDDPNVRAEIEALHHLVRTSFAGQNRLLHERKMLERELAMRNAEIAGLRGTF